MSALGICLNVYSVTLLVGLVCQFVSLGKVMMRFLSTQIWSCGFFKVVVFVEDIFPAVSFHLKLTGHLFAILVFHSRLVNSALASELEKIHAFSQKTLTPTEWQERQAEN